MVVRSAQVLDGESEESGWPPSKLVEALEG